MESWGMLSQKVNVFSLNCRPIFFFLANAQQYKPFMFTELKV